MKRNYIPFITGMVTMLLLVGLLGSSLADGPARDTAKTEVRAAGKLDGTVAYGEAGVALFGREQVAAGAVRTTEQGAAVPTVLTYTDEKGEAHYFVNAETVAEVLDVAYGVVYRPDLNCVDFGTTAPVDADGKPLLDAQGDPPVDKNGDPIYWSAKDFFSMRTLTDADGTVRVLGIGKQTSTTTTSNGDATVTIRSGGDSDDEELRERHEAQLQKLRQTPTAPEYGLTYGPFTEVAPAEMDKASYLGRFLDGSLFQGEKVAYTFSFTPLAKYAAIVIENQGEEDVLAQVERPYAVGGSNGDTFAKVRVPAGATLTRAFRIENNPGAELRNDLAVEITSIGGQEVRVRMSSEQYSASARK